MSIEQTTVYNSTLMQLCFDKPELIVGLFCVKPRPSSSKFIEFHIIVLFVLQWSRDIMLWHLCAWFNL